MGTAASMQTVRITQVVTCAPVRLDSPEMDLPAKVCFYYCGKLLDKEMKHI